jgi:hypothetical protein
MIFDVLKKKVSKISVDIDEFNIRRLLNSWLMAKKFFPNSKIKVLYSPSHEGFHLIIYKKVSILENILWRALLWDDEKRLMISLRRIALNWENPNPDIAFDLKSGKKAEEIDFEKIIYPYRKIVKKILKKWDKVDEMVEELAKKIEQKIQKKDTFVTMFAFNTKELKEKLQKICSDIAEKDSTFKYKIYQNFSPKSDYLLAIFSGSETQAFERGEWFIRVLKGKKEVLSKDDLNKIIKFGKEKYYWVKKLKD